VFLSLVPLTGGTPLSAMFLPHVVTEPVMTRSSPNQTRFSQNFDPSWGVPTPYKLEPRLYPSVLLGFRVIILP
jgi:hypothetical protein